MKIFYTFLLTTFLMAACSEAPQPSPNVEAFVSSTLTAIATSQQGNPQQPEATEVPLVGQLVVKPSDPNATPGYDYFPPMGTITGRLSFPSSFIPSMRVVFFTSDNIVIAYTDTAQNQATYSIELPEGTYHVVAYPYDPANPPSDSNNTFAGGFTDAVPCGLSVDCTDHTLLDATVVAGQTVIADPDDWYAPPGSFPSMPR